MFPFRDEKNRKLLCDQFFKFNSWRLAISRKREKNAEKPTKELKIAAILEQLKLQECKSVTLASHQPVFYCQSQSLMIGFSFMFVVFLLHHARKKIPTMEKRF